MSETSDLELEAPSGVRRVLRSAGWWMLTLTTLVVIDDLTFGPAFWAVSLWAGAGFAVLAVLAVYVPAQIYIVRRATTAEPGPIALFFLNRLELQRRSDQVAQREARVRGRVIGLGSAVLLTPIIGGVLPPLLLFRMGFSQAFVRRVSYATAPLYALEFALLHGLVPSLL